MTLSGSAPKSASPMPSLRKLIDAPMGTVVVVADAAVVVVAAVVVIDALNVVVGAEVVEDASIVDVTSVAEVVDAGEESLHEATSTDDTAHATKPNDTHLFLISRVCRTTGSTPWHHL